MGSMRLFYFDDGGSRSHRVTPAGGLADPANRRPPALRDFMTAGLLLRRMNSSSPGRRNAGRSNGMPPDNWIYIQEPDVRMGRLQVFNNWSPALVADPRRSGLGSSISAARATTYGPWTAAGSSILRPRNSKKLV